MPQRIEFDGEIHEFPDDFTDADIAAALDGGPPEQPSLRERGARGLLTSMVPGVLELSRLVTDPEARAGAMDSLRGARAEAAQLVYGGGDLLRRGYNAVVPESMETERIIDQPDVQAAMTAPDNPEGRAGEAAATMASYAIPARRIAQATASLPLWARSAAQSVTAGSVGAASEADPKAGVLPAIIAGAAPIVANAPELVRRGLGVSRARAAQNLDSVSRTAARSPINVEGPGQQGLRAMELQQRGATLPRVVTQFMRRVTDPKGADMTFSEARDFYSNLSRMSANDFGRLTPAMRRQVGSVTRELGRALQETANTAGVGREYASGMREYARAARLEEAWQRVSPQVIAAIRTGIGGLIAGKGFQVGFTD